MDREEEGEIEPRGGERGEGRIREKERGRRREG